MKERALLSPRLATYGSAIVLSVLTLAVFAYSKDKGPESAVRNYHQAVIDGHMEGVRKMETGEALSGNALPQLISQNIAQSQSVSLGKIMKDGRRAYVDVIYDAGQGRLGALRFVVDKPHLKWRIEPDETLRLMNRMNRYE